MFQGPKTLRVKNWDELPFAPGEVDVVLLTHTHIDHIGYLPRLAAQGFNGRVLATEPTVEMARVLLLDSAHLHEEDADYRNRKKLTSHPKALPLFTTKNVKEVLKQFEPVKFGDWINVTDGIKCRYHIAGHVLGAGSIEVVVQDGDRSCSILFSGDVGRYGDPLAPNPEPPPETDYIVCESTYGGRIHEPEDPRFKLAEIVNRIVKEKRILLIPAFAFGRTQQIIYLVSELMYNGAVPPINIHVDSPMAVTATDLYSRYSHLHSADVAHLNGEKGVLAGKHVTLHRKRKSSKKLNELQGPAIILSASGMMAGGRILHHLINRLPDRRTTLMIVGFMAEGTIGRRIADGADMVYIHKQPVQVRAELVQLHGLSGHADHIELLHWLEPVKKAPRRVFITHGEVSQSEAMAEHLRRERQWETHIPELHETVEL